MKSVSVEERYMNIKEFFSSIGREFADLVGPKLVGKMKSDNKVEMEVSEVKEQQSERIGDLEGMFDYSQQVKAEQDQESGKAKGKGRGRDKGEKQYSQMNVEVQNQARQTSRQTGKSSKGRTNEGYEQEL